jgi:hypothetical protein
MTAVPPALPGTAQNKRLKESHEFTRLLLGKADMRVEIQRIKILSCGSAHIAGCLGAYLIEHRSTTQLGEIDNRRIANGEHQRALKQRASTTTWSR